MEYSWKGEGAGFLSIVCNRKAYNTPKAFTMAKMKKGKKNCLCYKALQIEYHRSFPFTPYKIIKNLANFNGGGIVIKQNVVLSFKIETCPIPQCNKYLSSQDFQNKTHLVYNND